MGSGIQTRINLPFSALGSMWRAANSGFLTLAIYSIHFRLKCSRLNSARPRHLRNARRFQRSIVTSQLAGVDTEVHCCFSVAETRLSKAALTISGPRRQPFGVRP